MFVPVYIPSDALWRSAGMQGIQSVNFLPPPLASLPLPCRRGIFHPQPRKKPGKKKNLHMSDTVGRRGKGEEGVRSQKATTKLSKKKLRKCNTGVGGKGGGGEKRQEMGRKKRGTGREG